MRGKFVLEKVANLAGTEIYSSGKFTNSSWKTDTLDFFVDPNHIPDSVKVVFLSPVRMKFNGRYIDSRRFTLELFIKSIARRLKLLSKFYGVDDVALSYIYSVVNRLQYKARLRWKELERFSYRQKTRMKLGGLVGTLEVSLTANPLHIYSLLKIAEVVHVGKNTTFGLDKIYLTEGGSGG